MLGLVVCLVAVVGTIAESHNFHGRILGGQDATIERFPFQASIEQQYHGHFCGGVIVSKNRVLTAAHCFERRINLTSVKVRVGSAHHGKGGKVYTILKTRSHPERRGFDYDVNILHVSPDIEFSNTTQPIQLVAVTDKPKKGDILTVSGWGATVASKGLRPRYRLSPILQAVDVPTLDDEVCRNHYKRFIAKFSSNMICAAGVSKNASIKGDSGGPVINKKGQLVGIVSWGHSASPPTSPSVFASIADPDIHKFIDEHIGGSQ